MTTVSKDDIKFEEKHNRLWDWEANDWKWDWDTNDW